MLSPHDPQSPATPPLPHAPGPHAPGPHASGAHASLPAPRAVGRRSLLVGAGAGLLALAGCGSSSSSPRTTPGMIQQTQAPAPGRSATAEASAASWATVGRQLQQTASLFQGAASAKGATPAFAAWAKASASLCATQAALLLTGDPLGTSRKVSATVPRPAAQDSMKTALAAISARQDQQAASLTALARSASAGDEALLLVSLAAAAHATAGQHAAPVATNRTPGRVTIGSRADALQVLLGHVEAAIQGYETGAGSLPQTSAEVTAAQQRIQALWQVRDDVQQQVLQASATPAPAPLDHRMPGTFGSVPADHRTWALLETNILDAWARVAAASTGTDRGTAIARVMQQVDVVQNLGGAISTWPGWA